MYTKCTYIGYNGNRKRSIEFTLQRPSTLGWNEAEVQAIYDSYDDARFYGDLARYLGLEWTVNNEDIVTADDILAQFCNSRNRQKSRVSVYIMITCMLSWKWKFRTSMACFGPQFTPIMSCWITSFLIL